MTALGRITLFLSFGAGCFVWGYGLGLFHNWCRLRSEMQTLVEASKERERAIEALKIDAAFGFRAQRRASEREIRT